MALKDPLGSRMKENYENRAKTYLTRRMPVAIRLDGCHFHTFTKGFEKPFDKILMKTMQSTMKYLCKNIQGCVFGYTQSDEITLILVDYKNLDSDAWFDNQVQKICSVSASMATMAFNNYFQHYVLDEYHPDELTLGNSPYLSKKPTFSKYYDFKYATFDARCFNIPKEEVCNLIYWRQQDATRNSILSVGQYYFSHKELEGKNTNIIQDMLFKEHNVNWNDYPIDCKRGTACFYSEEDGWFIDKEMPILTGENRQYVERYIYVGE